MIHVNDWSATASCGVAAEMLGRRPFHWFVDCGGDAALSFLSHVPTNSREPQRTLNSHNCVQRVSTSAHTLRLWHLMASLPRKLPDRLPPPLSDGLIAH
jgi:hypothetical protein